MKFSFAIWEIFHSLDAKWKTVNVNVLNAEISTLDRRPEVNLCCQASESPVSLPTNPKHQFQVNLMHRAKHCRTLYTLQVSCDTSRQIYHHCKLRSPRLKIQSRKRYFKYINIYKFLFCTYYTNSLLERESSCTSTLFDRISTSREPLQINWHSK